MGTQKVVKQLQDIKTLPIGELRDAALYYLDLDRKSSMQAWVNLERFECKEQIGHYWGAFSLLTETLVFSTRSQSFLRMKLNYVSSLPLIKESE